MDTEKLTLAIAAFTKNRKTNTVYYEENWKDRKERKIRYNNLRKLKRA